MDNTNVEVIIYNWLKNNDKKNEWNISADLPTSNIRPDKFIVFDRTAGGRQDMVLDQATILVEIYHKTSRIKASNKAQELASKATEMLEQESVTHVDVNSIVHLDDTIGGYHRYQLYINIYKRM